MEKFQIKQIAKNIEDKITKLNNDLDILNEKFKRLLKSSKSHTVSLSIIEEFLESKYGEKWDSEVKDGVYERFNNLERRNDILTLAFEKKIETKEDYKKLADELRRISFTLDSVKQDSLVILSLYLEAKEYSRFNNHVKWMDVNNVNYGDDARMVMILKNLKERCKKEHEDFRNDADQDSEENK